MNNTNNQSSQNQLPSNLTEIRNAAASMFSDAAVVSVNVQASFGTVTVNRDGSVRMEGGAR